METEEERDSGVNIHAWGRVRVGGRYPSRGVTATWGGGGFACEPARLCERGGGSVVPSGWKEEGEEGGR